MRQAGKRIAKWKSSRILGEVYLKDMAEQGLLLEEITPLRYFFREGEPQHLWYRIEEPEHALREEERADYAKEGWQEVCHYGLEYVFAKEGDAFGDVPEEWQAMVQEGLDARMEAERKNLRSVRLKIFIMVAMTATIALALWFLIGTGQGEFLPKDLENWMAKGAVRIVKIGLLALGASLLRMRDLRKKKEQAEDGYIPEAYTNLPIGFRFVLCFLLLGLIGLAIWTVSKGGR